MSVVHACKDPGDGSDKMDQITLDIEKAACRLRCARRAIEEINNEEVEDAVCVLEEVADCLLQIQNECSHVARMFHFHLQPAARTAMNDAIDEFLETVKGNWPDRYYCTHVFVNHAVRLALRNKTAIADAVAAFREQERQEESQRRQSVPVMPAQQSSGKKKAVVKK